MEAQSVPVRTTHESQEAMSDAELVIRSLNDPPVFAVLYRRYGPAVYQYAHRSLANRQAAEDAMQNTFLKAFSSLSSCREPAGFRSWLFSIAHNVIVDIARSRRSHVAIDEMSERAESPDATELMAMQSIEQLEIALALSQLPERQREVVELRLQGLRDQEIAAVLGQSHGAVRAAQHRAILGLRDILGVPRETEVTS